MQTTKSVVLGLVLSLLAVGLWAQQGENKMMDMNDMPYAKVKAMMSSPAQKEKAMEMAKKNNVELMAGQTVEGEPVSMKGELTGANCYLSKGLHGHNHAMCAKACVAAGSPIVFISEDGKVYTVLTGKDGMPLPEKALDDLGHPGVTVKGVLVNSQGVQALALRSVES